MSNEVVTCEQQHLEGLERTSFTQTPSPENSSRPAPQIVDDRTPNHQLLSMFESSFRRKIFNPFNDLFATEYLWRLRESWYEQGVTTVFTSGVFDLTHLNHKVYLLHTKLAAAPYHYEQNEQQETGKPWEGLTAQEQEAISLQYLSCGALKLVVSIDGNKAVAKRKGWNPQKGGHPRPIYDWETRSRDVLGVAVEIEPSRYAPIVDAVTLHDNQEELLRDSPHSGILEIAEFVNPDVWSVYFESEDILQAVVTTHKDVFRNINVIRLMGVDFYSDSLLRGSFSTTLIAQRIGGQAAKSLAKGK